MFPTAHTVVPVAPRSFMSLREIDKDASHNAYLMERFEAHRTDVARVASCVAHPNILVMCTANGFFQVVDMASGSYKLYLLFLDDGDNFIDLPPRCLAIDPAPSLVASSVHIGASEPGSRELALVFAPSYTPTVCHASTLTGVVHDLISLRSRPSALSIDGDFAVAGDSSGEACAWRSGAYTLLWRQSLHRAAGVSDESAVAITTALQHRETCFFAMSNASIVVCSVRSGVVLTTLLDAGQGSGVACILPTPPFADAVVEVSNAGQLTVWAPPLKAVGPSGAPAATSLASIPDALAGQGWQVLNVVKTDMAIESASLHNGFLALGGTDGRVALFDATQLSVKKKGASSKRPDKILPMLVSFDLDLPIKHCGVANDNHFSIATGIGDVWRWPVQEVLPPVHGGGKQRRLSASGDFNDDHGEREDETDEEEQEADDIDDRDSHHHHHHHHHHDAASRRTLQQRQKRGRASGRHHIDDDNEEDEDDDDAVPQHSTHIPTPDASGTNAGRRVVGGRVASSSSRRGASAASSSGAVPHADSDLELPLGDEDNDNDAGNDDDVEQGRKLHEEYQRRMTQANDPKQTATTSSTRPPLAGQQQQQQPAATRFDPQRQLAGDDDDDDERGEWFQREGTQPPEGSPGTSKVAASSSVPRQPAAAAAAAAAGGATVIMVDDDDDANDDGQRRHTTEGDDSDNFLDGSATAMPRSFGAVPQPVPRDVSLSPSNTDEHPTSPKAGAAKGISSGQQQQQHQQHQQSRRQQPNASFSAAASSINDTSLPSELASVMLGQPGSTMMLDHHHLHQHYQLSAAAGSGATSHRQSLSAGGAAMRTPASNGNRTAASAATPAAAAAASVVVNSSTSSPFTEGTASSTDNEIARRAAAAARASTNASAGGRTAAAGVASSSSGTSGGSSSSQRGSELRRGASITDEEDASTSHGSPEQQQRRSNGTAGHGTLSPNRRPPTQQPPHAGNTTRGAGAAGATSPHHDRQAAAAADSAAGGAHGGIAAGAALGVGGASRRGGSAISPPRELERLTHGPRMNPTVAQAMLDRAVNIQEKNGGAKSSHELAKSTPHISKLLRAAARGEDGVVMRADVMEEFDLQQYAEEHKVLVAALEHQHAIKGQHYKPDDVAYYAIDLRSDAADHHHHLLQVAALEDGKYGINNINNNNNNSRPLAIHTDRKGPAGFVRLDENKEAVGRLSPTALMDDLMPASSRTHVIARRKDPVYERQKKLAGPQFHDHLCHGGDLLQPPMPSTVFFCDKMSVAREPKSLVLPLPVPSTPLAF